MEPDGVNRRREYPSDLTIQAWANVPGLFQRARTTNNTKPVNEYDALLRAAPFQDIPTSADEEEALREAVASIVDLLPAKERQIIEAMFYEQDVPVREIGRRIDVPKTSVARLRERALMTLADLMSNNQTIRRHLMGETPVNWEEAARQVLLDLSESTYFVEDFTNEVTDAIDQAYVHWTDIRVNDMWVEFANAGRIAWTWLHQMYQQSPAKLFEEIIELLCERQSKYGHANIMKFVDLGLCVRMSDKAARLGNLEEGGRSFDDESVIDTWMDILGYSVIAGLLAKDWFMLELPE
jgi:hypothetical protein